MRLLGIDTGGTFTDFVYHDGGALRVHKLLSTPDAPERAILQGVADLGLSLAGLRVVHGSTVATNAVLERKGVPTLYVSDRGLGDLLTIGRQARAALYDLQPPPVPAPVPPELCLEVGGRLGADGATLEPLTDEDLARLREAIERLRPRAVAINLLFSWLDDTAERRLEAAVPPGVFVSRSSAVLAEYREYERGIATWLNAWVGPIMQGYLRRLCAGLAPARVDVMQSSGGTVEAGQAGDQAVTLLLSGPAGGLSGARHVGRATGRERLLTLDMGGTSTDVALIDGEPAVTTEGHIAGYPVGVPMVDMHTIGAGGGSIAYLDEGGMLRVGPESAGADPGPACYGRGGRLATVTDANLLLGRLRPDAFLGGRMRLDAAAARAALLPLAEAMGMSPEEAAAGVVRVANEHMAHALRVISVQRGIDPRGFTLLSFGGAGGLHVCALAEALGMTEALVPVQAGVLSALGMLVAPPERRLSRSLAARLDALDGAGAAEQLDALAAAGRRALLEEGVEPGAIEERRSADLRYLGQSYTLELPWGPLAGLAEGFSRRHRERYGHDLDLPVEVVNLRVAARAPASPLPLPTRPGGGSADQGRYAEARLHAIDAGVPVYRRDALGAGQRLVGPALITETVSTTYLAPGWGCVVDGTLNLLLARAI